MATSSTTSPATAVREWLDDLATHAVESFSGQVDFEEQEQFGADILADVTEPELVERPKGSVCRALLTVAVEVPVDAAERLRN